MGYLPPPSQEVLEDLTAQVLPKIFGTNEPATRFGRSGQAQYGVDVVVRNAHGLIGAQCKAYVAKSLRESSLDDELKKAHGFEPPLTRFIIVTSVARDAQLTKWALSATIHGRLGVQIWFWEDICEFLKQHDLLGQYAAQVIDASILFAAIKSLGLHVSSISAADAGPSPVPMDAETQELELLLAAGCATGVVNRLLTFDPMDESQRFLLARAYVQLRRDEDAKIAIIGTNSAKSLALASLVNARLGDSRASDEAIKQALCRADDDALGYVSGMAISRQFELHPKSSMAELVGEVPVAARKHPSVLTSMGDIASQNELYSDAIAFYEEAERYDCRSVALRRVAILANRLALALAKLPSGDLFVSDPSGKTELEELRNKLRAELNDELDSRLCAAILHNIHLAALVLHDLPDSMACIRAAIDREPQEIGLWRRWALTTIVSDKAVDAEFLERAPQEPELALILSELDVRRGNRRAAKVRVDAALESPDLAPAIEARLSAQSIILDSEDGIACPRQGERILALANTLRSPVHAIIRLATVVNAPGMKAVANDFFSWLAVADLGGLEEDDQLALVATLINRSCEREVARFLPLLRRRSSRPDGAVDTGVLPLLVQALIGSQRFHEAAETALSLAAAGVANGLFLRSIALENLGLPGRALSELMAENAATLSSVSLVRRCVKLGLIANRLREVQKFVRAGELPVPQSAVQRSALYSVLVELKDGRREKVATEALQDTDGFEDVAQSIFVSGLRSRHSGGRRVSANSIVTIQREDGYRGHYWVGPAPSPAVDSPSAEWLEPALGLELGDYVNLEEGPFAGERVLLVAAKRPEKVLLERAFASATNSGAFARFSGEGGSGELIDAMRAQLAAQVESHSKTLSLASSVGLPACSMGELFGKPPRFFLRVEGRWVPRSHSGFSEDIDAESRNVAQAKRWVVDPATVCLIVECGLQGLFAIEESRPWVTTQAQYVLRMWQIQEWKAGRGARGTMHLDSRGRLVLIETTAARRKALSRFWRSVWKFIENYCESGQDASDDGMASLVSWSEIIDIGITSSIVVAKENGCSLLSDELVARVAAAELGVPSAGLRAMVIGIPKRYGSSMHVQAIKALCELSKTGRSFFAITSWMLIGAMRLPAHERYAAIEGILSTVRAADPVTSWPILLVALSFSNSQFSMSHLSRVNEKALVRLVLKYVPKPNALVRYALTNVVVGSFDHAGISPPRPPSVPSWEGRRMRGLRRAIARYLVKEAKK